MAIQYHLDQGSIVICDFRGFVKPEMVKRRPAIVISPRFRDRGKLCTIVPLSSQKPPKIMPYHCQLYFNPLLPPPYDYMIGWVKADMFATVSFDRLFLPRAKGRDENGQRIYDKRQVSDDELNKIQKCILHAIGLSRLTYNL